jgi:perosamine synthetase
MKKRIYLMRPVVGTAEINHVKDVIKSKFLTESKVTTEFESLISKYVHANHAIATTSATTALHGSLVCSNVKGKKVLVSDFTFPATILAIQLAGGIPILTDVDKYTMNISKEIVESGKEKNAKIILPVSLFGNPLDLEFYTFMKKGVTIIEDAATNLGTKIGNKHVGELADITCFSFHPRKIITTGEGGMITTNNSKIASKIRSYKNFGKRNNSFVDDGTNYKLSDIQSAIGIEQIKKIETIIKKRIKIAKYYSELINKINNIEIQKETPKARHTYQSFTCIINKSGYRDKIIRQLAENNIESSIGTYALHCLPKFKKCLKNGKLNNSKFLYQNSISLPLHEELTKKDQELICKIINKILK